MKKIVGLITKTDRAFLFPILVSAISILLLLITFWLLYSYIPPKIPLFYSRTWGETQLASKEQFFVIPALIALVTLINTLLAWQIHPSQKVLKRLLLFTIFVADVLLFIAGVKVLTILL